MKIFGLIILTTNQHTIEMVDSYNKGYNNGHNHYLVAYKDALIRELNRLKQDHWDKDAFDRIIERLKR